MLAAYADLIATAYALGPVLDFTGPIAHGMQGEVWRLHTERGVWAVKRSYADFAPADAQRAGEFQSLARAQGVPTPAAVPDRDGRYGHPVGSTVVGVNWGVELLGPSSMVDPATVGTAVAALHRAVRPADGGMDPWCTEPVGTDGWDELLAEARRQRAPFAERLADYRAELLALEALLTPMAPVQTCHLDLWADNIRRTADGGLTILDWDNCGPGDPSRELALVLFEYAHTSPDRVAQLYGAYQAAGGPGRVRAPSDFSILIAVLGHSAARDLRRWLDPSAEDGAAARSGVDPFLDDPLTRSTLDGILTVTRDLDRSRV